MTPSKKDKTTVLRIEKVKRANIDESKVAHTAGGQHSGLVINKQAISGCLLNSIYFCMQFQLTLYQCLFNSSI